MSGCCYLFWYHSKGRELATVSWYSLHIGAKTLHGVPCCFSALGRPDTPCQQGFTNRAAKLIGTHWVCSSRLGSSLSGMLPWLPTVPVLFTAWFPNYRATDTDLINVLLVALWDSQMPVFFLPHVTPSHTGGSVQT